MILTCKELQWFHNETEFKLKRPLGVIYLTSVYHCVPANTHKTTDDLNVKLILIIFIDWNMFMEKEVNRKGG